MGFRFVNIVGFRREDAEDDGEKKSPVEQSEDHHNREHFEEGLVSVSIGESEKSNSQHGRTTSLPDCCTDVLDGFQGSSVSISI